MSDAASTRHSPVRRSQRATAGLQRFQCAMGNFNEVTGRTGRGHAVGIRAYGVLQPVREAFGLSAGAVDLWRHVWSLVRQIVYLDAPHG
jgi:hypothetical protein